MSWEKHGGHVMLEQGKISARQYMIVVALYTVGDALLYIPSMLASAAKQDAWIAALLGSVYGFCLGLLYTALGKRFPHVTITKFSELILGTWLGRTAALMFISYFFIDASLMLLEIGDFITMQLMPETPIEAILVLFAVIVVFGTRLGVEPIARTSELLFPWFLLLFFILVISLLPLVKITNVQPVYDGGFMPIFRGSLTFLGYMLETIVVTMMFPFVNQPKAAVKGHFYGILIGSLFLTVFCLICIMVLGTTFTTLYAYPSYALAQKISIGNFFERIEVFFAVIWFITLYVKISVCYSATSLGLAQVFKMSSYRAVTYPLAMIMVIIGLNMIPNRVYFDTFVRKIWMPYSLTYGVVLPAVLLAVAIVRKIDFSVPRNRA